MFWDASALVPVIVKEEHSISMKAMLEGDESVFVWWGTMIECVSAITRRVHAYPETSDFEARDVARLRATLSMTIEIEPTSAVREEALRVLRRHPLRAADALQLAAALEWCERRPRDAQFVSLDRRLREAADREGFTVLPAELAS